MYTDGHGYAGKNSDQEINEMGIIFIYGLDKIVHSIDKTIADISKQE
jgi:ATP-dependent protease HslVU (ClpYQ) ATPase subunit